MRKCTLLTVVALLCGCDRPFGTLEAEFIGVDAGAGPDVNPFFEDEPEPSPEPQPEPTPTPTPTPTPQPEPTPNNDVDDDGVLVGFDCNDNDHHVLGPVAWAIDGDHDGAGISLTVLGCTQPAGTVPIGGLLDCNDTLSNVHPGAPEVCDGLDNDCDGQIDKDLYAVYPDSDGDGYGDDLKGLLYVCATPPGYSQFGGDCNDDNFAVHPGASEVCNSLDDDCDGLPDDGLAYDTGWPDLDGDGYGDPNGPQASGCPGSLPQNYAFNNVDCDDAAANIHPGLGGEICNGEDDNCNGQIDESEPQVNLCDDGNPYTTDVCDGDQGCTYEQAVVNFSCELPEGYSEEDYVCGVGVFYEFSAGNWSGAAVQTPGELLFLPLEIVCLVTAQGGLLHANSYVLDPSDPFAIWVGGSYASVSVGGDELDGSPGTVTFFDDSLDYVFDFEDFEPYCVP